YKSSTIELLLDHFRHLLQAIVHRPDEQIGHLNMLSGLEKRRLLFDFNTTEQVFSDDQIIADLFEQKAAAHPEAVALQFNEQQWTFQAVNEKANLIAHHLQTEHQVKAGDFVGIMMPRSEWIIFATLGILKAGAAYVPVDPSWPNERKNFLIQDTQLRTLFILADDLFETTDLDVVSFALDLQFDSLNADWAQAPLQRSTRPEDPAYVMYTSGTTGQAKGIVVAQQSVVQLSQGDTAIAIYPSDRVLQWSNFAFDGSVYEIFSSLLNGARLHLIEAADAASPSRLAQHIREQQLSVAFMTTALFNAFVDQDVQALLPLRRLLFGGEMASPLHVEKALAVLGPDQLINGYGPTETTVFATYHPVQEIEGGSIPIGRPLPNTKIYIVNPQGVLAGIGVVGEIWIGGTGVAKAYLNQATLSQKHFIDNPFTQRKNARLY
ncbi:MAG: AMP-binding protein, partial [Bacteroidota bacterium]